jgi:hypothetical protein
MLIGPGLGHIGAIESACGGRSVAVALSFGLSQSPCVGKYQSAEAVDSPSLCSTSARTPCRLPLALNRPPFPPLHVEQPCTTRLATKPVDATSGFRFNCWALDEVSTTPMLGVDSSEILAALAGVMPRGSDASAMTAVPAMERMRRLERGTTTSSQKAGVLPLCPISSAVSAWCERSLLARCGGGAGGGGGYEVRWGYGTLLRVEPALRP